VTSSPFSWDELTGKWRELYEEQAKVSQMWLDSQTQLAKAMAGVSDEDGASSPLSPSALAELWKSGMSLGSVGTSLPGLDSTAVANATLGRMLDPVSLSLMGGNQVGEAIRRVTEAPQLADVGSVERRMAKIMELYVEVQSASRGYEAIVARAWMEVNQSFAAAMAKRYAGAEPVGPMEALRTWLGLADEALTRVHRSDEYLKAQRELLRAGMDFLLAERELVELLVEPVGLPTRSEIDELHRTVHDLKRELRALRKAGQPAGRPPAKKAQAKRAPAKKTPAQKASSTSKPRTKDGGS
jgi:hypothetical protein